MPAREDGRQRQQIREEDATASPFYSFSSLARQSPLLFAVRRCSLSLVAASRPHCCISLLLLLIARSSLFLVVRRWFSLGFQFCF
ncbi:uncharacterized protein DS421_10g303850 [Arachis hypogaea]|nr:uncharacterized protein DS421_10g303850 [Arachis hypogaea]